MIDMEATLRIPPISSSSSSSAGPVAPSDALVYWRRRAMAGVLLVLLGAGLWTMATWAVNSSIGVDPVGADRPAAGSGELYIVQPGDTLWSIAAGIDSDSDVRDTVDYLADTNGGSSILVGQRLVIGR